MKKTTFILMLLVCSFTKAFATDYYTASPNATLAGNAVVSNNWTTNPDGLTGLTDVTIATTDNLIILNNGIVSINSSTNMTIGNLTINSGGKISLDVAKVFTINDLTWNGTLNSGTVASGYFTVKGNVTGTTAIQDSGSVRGVYLSPIVGATISLTQLPGGYSSGTNGILIANGNVTLSGNCKFYSPINYNQNKPLDLAGHNLQVTSILGGNASRVLKGNANSTLTLSGGTDSSVIYLASGFDTLAGLNIDNDFSGGSPTTTITGNLTVSSLKFGVPTGTSTPRTLNVVGNFTLANNGTMRVQAQGALFGPGTDYDQIAVTGTGNVTLGTNTTLKIDYINGYSPANGDSFNFGTYTGTKTGTFTTITSGTSGNVTYASQNITYTTSSTLSVEKNIIAQGIQLYPNPIVDVLNISAPGATAAIAVQVLDLSGKTVARAKSKSTSATVSLSNAAPGIYLVKVTDGTSTYTQKVIKK